MTQSLVQINAPILWLGGQSIQNMGQIKITVYGRMAPKKDRVWHVIYGWKDLPVGSKSWYSIQCIGPWKYEQIIKTIFFTQSSEKTSVFFNIVLNRDGGVWNSTVSLYTHIAIKYEPSNSYYELEYGIMTNNINRAGW